MRGIIAEIDTHALRHNFRLLSQHAGHATMMAVVKADAYGHGLTQIVPTLVAEGCQCFAVTDADEGRVLRLLLQSLNADASILMLAGIADQDDAHVSVLYRLSPVVIDRSQLTMLAEHHFNGHVWLKIDTGMARTGVDDPKALQAYAQQCNIQVVGLLSHLACADTPEHPLNAQQVRRFDRWRAKFPLLHASLLNTAGLLTMPGQVYDAVRPGIGLYGIEPCVGRTFGLQAVMHLFASVVQVRSLKAGDTVGYGGSFVANQAMRIAIVGAGYADGIARGLSNQGVLYTATHSACPIVGHVCMDYCMVALGDADVKKGQTMTFWSRQHLVSSVADSLHTIAYELLTRVGCRVHRQVRKNSCTGN
ncbi:MAG: alanine racemase [Mariprofundaceae bacterium]|nr:alanine racemase [Mariprofundaceae bacterium]